MPESTKSPAEVKERPILFSGPMVRALLDGRKTQTRRIVKPRRHASLFAIEDDGSPVWADSYIMDPGNAEWRMRDNPYGVPGDRLWVKETHAVVPRTAYAMSEGVQQTLRPDDNHDAAVYFADWERSKPGRWRPSIHMPRWACRLVLEITDVRVERLLDCSNADAQAEGLQWVTPGMWSVDRSLPIIAHEARTAYFELWDHINGAGAAEANPWVWAVSFRVLSDEERQASRRGGEA
ncbi:hypothetical protein [Brevundimonas diminuta]|uniref:hypothetical protein n=1 Tax=Brevundimonas diminuta TaxID=293 RepID=UPI00320AE708